jgi:dTDP-4-amino-4,6-dideoxygalactose transaminase
MTVFSFHPVKHVAMGEGGAVTTENPVLAKSLRLYRNHGMVKGEGVESESAYDSDGKVNPWYYEMQALGFNYRLTDFQAALGINQLKKLPQSLDKRRHIAQQYCRLLEKHFPDGGVRPLKLLPDRNHAYHLFVVMIDFERFSATRSQVMYQLREKGIGTQVHYIPLYRQPYYRRCCSSEASEFPGAESYYAKALSIPMYPNLTETDCETIITELKRALGGNG